MTKFTEVVTQYTGPITLNSRSLQTSLGILSGNRKGQDITRQELSDLLNFLEAYIHADKILFDGTIPDNQVQKTLDNSEVLHKKGWLWKEKNYELLPIKPSNESETFANCQESATEASELIKNIQSDGLKSKPLEDKDAQEFAKAFRIANDLSPQARKHYAEELIQKNEFVGSKCVAGILSSTLPESDYFKIVYKLISSHKNNPDYLRHVSAELINRFRANYINCISAQHSSAYVPHPRLEDLKSQQTMLLWRYLGKHLYNDKSVDFPLNQEDNLSNEAETFPFGFSLLMQTGIKSVEDLLQRADELRDTSFTKYMASEEVMNKRFIHTMDKESLTKLQDELFEDSLSSILDSEDINVKTKRFNMPALISLSSVLSGGLINDNFIAMLTEIGILASSKTLDIGLNKIEEKQKIRVYRDNYSKWGSLLERSLKNNTRHKFSLESRVQKIFGIRAVV